MFAFINIIVDLLIFIVLILFLTLIKDKLVDYYENKLSQGIDKWMPIEQIREFRQLFYLIFAGLLFANLYYLIIINTNFNYIINFVIFDFILSVIAGVYIVDKDNWKKTIILLITLVPLTGFSITGSTGNLSTEIFLIFEIIHIIGIIYVIINCIQSFKKYSKSNKLGYTILVLYIIVFVCVFLSSYAECIGLLDSLVYCSNAFTSNGYGLVNATTTSGKIISLILVWSGYILSGVTTSILTLALINGYYKKKFKKLNNQIEQQQIEIKELNKLAKNQKKSQDTELSEINRKLDEILNK